MDRDRGGSRLMRRIAIPEDTLLRQRRAADPAGSVWVEANAGSGKTHVLTQRVLRLLLSGVEPQSILCLTYTKAAAAEMRRRVSAELGRWALADEAGLAETLSRLLGRQPLTPERARARTLFAHALETPGGLKIVTIHAFCESVLHRFPMEAGIPFDFTVIEDEERAAMILEAREAVLSGAVEAPGLADAVSTLFAELSDSQIGKAIAEALADARRLRPVLADLPGAIARLRAYVSAPAETPDALRARILAERRIGPAEIARVLEICPPKGGTAFEDKLLALGAAPIDPDRWCAAFLTREGKVPKAFPKKVIGTNDPDLAEALLAEAERLEALGAGLACARLVARSEALLVVLSAIVSRFEARKRARSLLDFDDLVNRLAALFANEALGPWVQYKLDAGITHILVDESQDTNPEQWRVVSAIAREFFTGDSAVERPRTLFAVGDEKQSIYSFQGADPALFSVSGEAFAERANAAERPFSRLKLTTSFRTLPGILSAVDLVFSDPVLAAAVRSKERVDHQSARAEPGGIVTLWPPVQQQGLEELATDWPLSVPETVTRSAPRQVAERIAAEIAGWIKSGRTLGPRNRPVRADDVLVLVQSRGAVFEEIIRALLRAGLPTPGADRLAVTSHIGVLDLIALADVLLNIHDDLQLAALLRSPLFGIDEDTLFSLCAPRGGRSVWSALMASTDPSCMEAASRLSAWRDALDFERPFEFFSSILYAGGGLRRFHTRFGPEIDDVFSEFLGLALDHEQSAQPSLQGFVAAIRAREILIKRELAESGAGVRVMTVHGAKGLEAPIVILADAATKPDATQLASPIRILAEAPGPLFVHAGRRADDTEETAAIRMAREQAQRDEYWRKLYVAMTRAEDELYITGPLTPGREAAGQIEGSWYGAIAAGLAGARAETDAEGTLTARVFPPDAPLPAPASGEPPALRVRDLDVPDLPPLPEPERREIIRPSRLEENAAEGRFDTLAEAARDPAIARAEGIALHALLQHLGRVGATDRAGVAHKAAAELLAGAAGDAEALADKALAILGRPEFAALFGPTSRAEIPFLLDGRRKDRKIRLAGRFDRLVIGPGEVQVIDFKSDAIVPDSPERSAYLGQLGLYALAARQLFPGRRITASILWTGPESLMNFSSELLMSAVGDFTMG
ncbi:double-strand break repair helicase AddA [Arsenicitalea aurantiaca]|uniref:DNA 3'-5' helicase n=1 Tax=Arsenicitalea aurantiaca TaxID=1783274 RepID=A0A433X8B8_9HYPH|nr:double-strand break repair helicase AddA [Arsenicitalea aurantiaca]RUT30315.1 double-strand break repair helicase AddA [Arsenicitalea aurantiaca]